MWYSTDAYLGVFIIISGFSLSLYNLRRVIKKNKFSKVLLSENVLLTCIGIAFILRAGYKINMKSMNLYIIERSSEVKSDLSFEDYTDRCNFWSMLISYGPIIVSLVNSFLSLIIDNYMHYQILENMKEKTEEEVVESVTREIRINHSSSVLFIKKHFSKLAILLQWIIPIIIALFMYPMKIEDKKIVINESRSVDFDTCLTTLEMIKYSCDNTSNNFTGQLRNNNISSGNYLIAFENEHKMNKNVTQQIDNLLSNINKIVLKFKNQTDFDSNNNITRNQLIRKSKNNSLCMRVCYIDNKNLVFYVFILAIACVFVPITISTIILAKIQAMVITKPNIKVYVSKELLYNILFWTPVMLDTFISLLYCSFLIDSMRTSLFNIIANIYQVVKNFMNLKYFQDNVVVPM